jgi:hypothetical protein
MTPTKRKIQPTTPKVQAATWQVAKRFTVGNTLYNRGCVIDDFTLRSAPNYLTLIDGRYVLPPPAGSGQGQTKPIQMAAPAPKVEDRSRVTVIRIDDAVESWRMSVVGTMEACNVDEPTAKDLLMADRLGSELYRAAVRIDAEARSIAERNFGRRPVRAL